MSDDRMRYSNTPLQDFNKAEKEKAKERANSVRSKSTVKDTNFSSPSSYKSTVRMGLLLILILPVFFLVAILSKNNMLLIVYAIITLLVLIPTWLFELINISARTTLTVIHITLALMAMITVVLNPTVRNTNTDNVRSQSSVTSIVQGASSLDIASQQMAAATNAPLVAEVQESALERTINDFFKAWENADYTSMAALCDTDKLDPSRSVETSMFHLRANRTPKLWEISDVSGNDSDYTRTVNMEVTIDKNNGSPLQVHRMQILLIKKNSNWFVDPKSLNSLGVISTLEEDIAQPIATIVPVQTPPPETALYYNPDGGSLYHLDQNCSSLAPKYLPMRGVFTVGQLNDAEFSKLEPCPECRAPRRIK